MKNRNAIIGNVKIHNDMVIKKNNHSDFNNLLAYLKSCNFNNILDYEIRDDCIIGPYIKDLSIADEKKALEIINTIALLHSKTVYDKDLNKDMIDALYQKYVNHLNYYINYFNTYLNNHIELEYYSPVNYLIIRNYSLIIDYLEKGKKIFNDWYEVINKKNTIRLCVVHNNLALDHFLFNNPSYLISWDHYKMDLPIIDLVIFFKRYYYRFDFKELFKTYLNIFSLNDDEILLLKGLLITNIDFEENSNELINTKNATSFVLYINRVLDLIAIF